MFLGGTIKQWIQLGEYCVMMIVLFTGIFAISCIVTNKVLHKKRKNELKTKNKKKSWFIDVA